MTDRETETWLRMVADIPSGEIHYIPNAQDAINKALVSIILDLQKQIEDSKKDKDD